MSTVVNNLNIFSKVVIKYLNVELNFIQQYFLFEICVYHALRVLNLRYIGVTLSRQKFDINKEYIYLDEVIFYVE